MTLQRVDETTFVPATAKLAPPTDAERELVARAESRRLALMGDNQALRQRYEEIMRWVNPPWDPLTERLDPRADETQTPERLGRPKIHADLANPVVDRWAVLQMGAPIIFRCKPPFVEAPVDNPDNPDETAKERRLYDIDRAIAQSLSSRVENQTNEWMEHANLHRTLLWAAWAKEAFGKAIIRTGWDLEDKAPYAELMENPSQVYYGWNRRYGRRKLAWVCVVEEMAAQEANRRFNLGLPMDHTGALDVATWTGTMDQGELDQRDEQSGANQQFLTVMEYHELTYEGDTTKALYAMIIAGRVVEGPHVYPWKNLPFRVLENQHIPTYQHGRSGVEAFISLNSAYDDMLTRQHEVIEFESGPRFKGIGLKNNTDADMPGPFEMIPLDVDEDVAQIPVGVDFFPSELHANQLMEATHRSTGLTPIAWGMSPNAQTSGRAMSAEWRAVELPMTGKLINMGPEIKGIFENWWDYAEAYHEPARRLTSTQRGSGLQVTSYRRFEVIWVPLDIRDKTEKTLDIIQRYQADLLDPETAIEESGYQNVDEIIAKIRSYMLDPVWNPLRRQQYLTLQQLELAIRQQMLEVEQMEAAAGGAEAAPAGGPMPPADLQAQGVNAAGEAAQGPGGPVTEGQNQPGMSPAGGGLPMETSILSQTPLDGGIGNRTIIPLGGQGPAPTAGQQPT